jgi:hypothetical protein
MYNLFKIGEYHLLSILHMEYYAHMLTSFAKELFNDITNFIFLYIHDNILFNCFHPKQTINLFYQDPPC